jgi:hypothetical protein
MEEKTFCYQDGIIAKETARLCAIVQLHKLKCMFLDELSRGVRKHVSFYCLSTSVAVIILCLSLLSFKNVNHHNMVKVTSPCNQEFFDCIVGALKPTVKDQIKVEKKKRSVPGVVRFVVLIIAVVVV